MTLHNDGESALFRSPPGADPADGPHAPSDSSSAAMRRLRHPFAVAPVSPADQAGRTPEADPPAGA